MSIDVQNISYEINNNQILKNVSLKIDQGKICSILGTPTQRTWAEGLKLAQTMNFKFPQFPLTSFQELIPHASYDAISLLQDLLRYDPNQRPSASQALQHPFFNQNTVKISSSPTADLSLQGNSIAVANSANSNNKIGSSNNSANSNRSMDDEELNSIMSVQGGKL